MSGNERRDLHALLRNDLTAFIQRTFQTVSPAAEYLPNWHIEAISHHLQQCAQGKIKRLLITLPPRSLKSVCVSVAFPAWLLGLYPACRVVCCSYADGLTNKLARDSRTVMESGWYQALFPGTRLNPKKNAETEFETTRQGYRYSTSVGGALTGRGGNFVLIDDPMKAADANSEVKRKSIKEWYDATLLSRLDNKRDDVIVLVMQRIHEDDLAAHVLEKGGWTHLDLPAIAEEDQDIPIGPGEMYHRVAGEVLHPAREPKEVLDQLKAEMGSMAFAAQYQQRPVPIDGNIVRWSWFKTYPHLPAIGSDGRIVQSWDTASKAGELHDYSACSTWLKKGEDFYLLDMYRDRLLYPDLKRKVTELARRHGAHTVLIEDKGSGTQLIQELPRMSSVRPIKIEPEGDKVTRMSNQSAKIEAGQVHLPERASWLDALKTELLAFPYGKFDDQVDSVSQFLFWIDWRRSRMSRSGRSIGTFY